ncbi:hypothetical protein [Paenibacillus sp. GP183]|uniref:hypothetical protein n=1 Tax=Paenibacillus sp. GP183 TaxID=1882751 RepID=UPI000894EE81|nr:hypothetical protein [Paenibacillus sp. GP183]SED17874.1 hypothetical protein SAMN05443246_5968 [Paenibacillus sp. GP183]
MSITQHEAAALIVKHQKDAYGWDTTVKEILSNPWHKVVGYEWVAKTYYGMDNFYASLDEVTDPTDGMSVNVLVSAERYDNYLWLRGKWVFNSEVTIDMYK